MALTWEDARNEGRPVDVHFRGVLRAGSATHAKRYVIAMTMCCPPPLRLARRWLVQTDCPAANTLVPPPDAADAAMEGTAGGVLEMRETLSDAPAGGGEKAPRVIGCWRGGHRGASSTSPSCRHGREGAGQGIGGRDAWHCG